MFAAGQQPVFPGIRIADEFTDAFFLIGASADFGRNRDEQRSMGRVKLFEIVRESDRSLVRDLKFKIVLPSSSGFHRRHPE